MLYKDYLLGSFKRGESTGCKQKTIAKRLNRTGSLVNSKDKYLRDTMRCDRLPIEHPARRYLISRLIPDLSLFYYTDGYKHWVNEHKPGEFKRIKVDEPRIIIPMRREDGTMFGCQGRSLEPKSRLRYITTLFEEHPKVFGLERMDKTKTVYIVEGPLDSLFLPNAIAMAGASVTPSDFGIENYVKIYDCEPRNPEICGIIEKCIADGERVVIWPPEMTVKDINDAVLAGIDVKTIVWENSCRGLTARLRYQNWRKC